MAPLLASALAAKVAQKRKARDVGRKQHAKLELFDSVDTGLVQELLEKGTKTSIRKLRRMGVLEGDESLDDLKAAFAEHVAEGEPIADGGREDEGIEGEMVDASKAYESLVVSLASKSKDRDLLGGVLETYGRAGRGLTLAEPDSDDVSDSDCMGHSNPSEDEADAGNHLDGADRLGNGSKPETSKNPVDNKNFVVAASIRQALQERNFMSEHLDLSVEDLDGDSALAERRKELHAASGTGFQPWATTAIPAVFAESKDRNGGEKSKNNFVMHGTMLMVSKGSACPAGVSDSLADYGVKGRVANRWNAVHENDNADRLFGDFESQKQAVIFAVMNSYMDMLYPLHRYPTAVAAKDPVMDAALLHIINHIVVSGDVIKKNNERLEKSRKSTRKQRDTVGDGAKGESDVDEEEDIICRDQGFVRPKVLILAPFRHHAKTIVDRLIQLAIQETRTDTIKNKSRFEDEFGVGEEDELVSERERIALSMKPNQHKVLFDGNCDDHFRLGIKMTRGSIRLFTDFYDSDILVASPLALSTRLEEIKKGEPDPKDFLSSIEISVLYRADALVMQNMAHVIKVFESLNAIPKQQHNSDILRVRDWYLGNRAGAYRQNIVLSSFESPEMKSLFSRYCLNHAGIARWKVAHRGVLGQITSGMKHVFERLEIDLQSPTAGKIARRDKRPNETKDEADIRFDHFTSHVWPKIREASRGQLLFVPSYFDLVRVRNFLRKEAASFVVLSEYTTPQDMSRARNYFNDGRRRVLLYTERCHFYNRHRIRGIKDIYYYQLPEHQQYYAELANFIDDDLAMSTINVVYTKRDVMRLERVVGTKRAKRMMGRASTSAKGDKAGTFVFV